MTATFPLTGSDVLARRRLLALGHTSAEIERARSSGWMTNLRRGVYAPTDLLQVLAPEQRHALRARAAALVAPTLAVSHTSAAVLHGLPVGGHALTTVHVTRPGLTGARRSPTRVLHVAPLDPTEVVEIDGVRTTSLARTLVDVGRTESFRWSVSTIDAAFHRAPQLVSEIPHLMELIRGHTGASAARRALRFADGRSESVGESLLRVVCHELDLPVLHLQCKIFDDANRFVARTDFAIPDHGVLMEFDGRIKYGRLLAAGQSTSDVVLVEKEREDRLRELGWHVIRVVWSDFSDTAGLQKRINTVLLRGDRAITANGLAGTVRFSEPIQLRR